MAVRQKKRKKFELIFVFSHIEDCCLFVDKDGELSNTDQGTTTTTTTVENNITKEMTLT